MKPFEKVAGPLRGYHLAAYACPAVEGRGLYTGYFKVFASRPAGYFDGRSVCLLKGSWEIPVDSPLLAVDKALHYGMQQVLNLPRARELKSAKEKRVPFTWERCALGVTR